MSPTLQPISIKLEGAYLVRVVRKVSLYFEADKGRHEGQGGGASGANKNSRFLGVLIIWKRVAVCTGHELFPTPLGCGPWRLDT